MSDNKNKLDIWSTRLALWSQIAMLAVVVFGYIYTVLPVVQHQRLQEEAAKLKIANEHAKEQLEQLKAEKLSAAEQLDAIKTEMTKLASSLRESKSRESKAIKRLDSIQSELKNKQENLSKALWKLFMLEFSQNKIVSNIRSLTKYYSVDNDNFILAAKDFWPKPYKSFMDQVAYIKKQNDRSGEFPQEYVDQLKQYVEKNKESLICDKVDFISLNKRYQEEVRALGPEIDRELTKYIDRVKRDAGWPEKEVLITDDFRSTARKSIVASKKFKVDKKYRDKLLDLRMECQARATKVVNSFKIARGID